MVALIDLKTIRRRMLSIGPDIGQSYSISSLTTTTCVVSRLATGTVTAGKYQNKWLMRADSTGQPADRERIITNFASSTGTFTHAGANYADTTATGETVEILNYQPELYDTAIKETLRHTRLIDCTIVPGSQAGGRWLGNLSWIEKPSDIVRIDYETANILSRNRFFDKWTAYDSNGALTPDWWTVAGAGATTTISTTQTWRERAYSLALARSGADVTLTQTIGLLDTGVTGTSGQTLRGARVDVVLRVYATVASRVRAFISDGVTTTRTAYHTGGSTWEELTTNATIASTATNLTFGIEVNTGDTTAYLGECFLTYNAVSDTQRRDGPYANYGEVQNVYRSGQGGLDLYAELPYYSIGGRYLVWSQRPCTALTASRVAAGTADADQILAPLDLLAIGAVWRMFDQLAYAAGEDTTRHAQIAHDFKKRFEILQASSLYVPGSQSPQERKLDHLRGPWLAYSGAGVRVGYPPRGGRIAGV